MEPLQIQFTFRSPVMRDGDRPLHFDALVAYGAMCEARDVGSDDAYRDSEDLSGYLAKANWGDAWVWKASQLFFAAGSAREWVNMVRGTRNVDYYAALASGAISLNAGARKARAVIPSGSGPLRAFQWLSATQWMTHANAWAVGDRDALLDLLTRHIKTIGKKGASGYGIVKTVTVEPADPVEVDRWMLRALPEQAEVAKEAYTSSIETIHPPYWRRADRVPAWSPRV